MWIASGCSGVVGGSKQEVTRDGIGGLVEVLDGSRSFEVIDLHDDI